MSGWHVVGVLALLAIWGFTWWCWWRVIQISRDTARISADTARIATETAQIWREFTATIQKRGER